MPANIAHMLIAHKALKKLQQKSVAEYTAFTDLLDDNSKNKGFRAYMNLGSMGPDLYYYSRMSSSIKDITIDGFVQAKGVTPWSYHLHSSRPNEFVLKLIQILFSDAERKNGKILLSDDDIKKLAYVAGHLTHIAADQIIHPVVNSIAGPYYRSGDNRTKHREAEVFQDYFLYQEVYRLEEKSGKDYDFFKQPFNEWADCIPSMTTQNTEEWFRYFLQRGFAETYGVFPEEADIENSVDNLLLTLRVCKAAGPYKKAKKEYENRTGSELFQQDVTNVNYLKYYRLAVELAIIYLIALYEVYYILTEGMDFTDKHKNRFLSIVRDADLSCPLELDIYDKALAALQNSRTMEKAIKAHSVPLLNTARIFESSAILQSVSNKDIVQA
jgi:hypothetical protein